MPIQALARCALAILALTVATSASAQPAADSPIAPADLRRHIDILASDAFGGRAPATPGERLTTEYIIRQLSARGVRPAAAGGAWLQPVPLVRRRDARHDASWTRAGAPVQLPANSLFLSGRDPRFRVTGAPVVFAGHGAVMPDRGIDQLAGANFQGAVALILFEGPIVEAFPSFAERAAALSAAGAVAVIGIISPDLPWDALNAAVARETVRLGSDVLPPASGIMSWEAATALVAGGGASLDRLIDDQPGSSFRSVTLPIRATISVTTTVEAFTSHNVVGRIPGSGSTGEAVILLAHWDHLGQCRGPEEADRICNGAIDNASGVATLIEAAARLASGPLPSRDIIVLATTAEEMGKLGAEQFARTPPIPRTDLVAALNVDTAAIGPAGLPVAVIGGTPEMERIIGRTAIALGRRLDGDRESDALVDRQDGAALARHGIPAAMAGGSFSDMARLGAFISGAYHGPDDEAGPALELGGAAEDATLLVALARAFADPATYPTPPLAGAAPTP